MNKYQKYKLIVITFFSVIFSLILFNYSSNGRYVITDDPWVVLDTRTGTQYILKGGAKYLELEDFEKYEKKK